MRASTVDRDEHVVPLAISPSLNPEPNSVSLTCEIDDRFTLIQPVGASNTSTISSAVASFRNCLIVKQTPAYLGNYRASAGLADRKIEIRTATDHTKVGMKKHLSNMSATALCKDIEILQNHI